MAIYNIEGNKLKFIRKVNFNSEKDIQDLVENNLEELFNLKFIASEFQVKNFRLDTIAFNEETNSFVIIEYKNTNSFSVIDQGYTYLSVLLNNKADFILEFNQKFNENKNKKDIDFSQSKVMFISPNYNKYQLNSVKFKDLAFELWKITKFSNNTVLFDRINIESNTSIKNLSLNNTSKLKEDVNNEIKTYYEEDFFYNKPDEIKELYDDIKDRIQNKFEDIDIVPRKHYICFKFNNHNLITLEPQSNDIKVYMGKKGNLIDNLKLTRDVSNIGHHGSGDYEFRVRNDDDIEYLLKLSKQVYNDI
ncbi:DUF5655 domain-containing protein [Methanobrevibacter wolinii]|uniref:DUF5655 domain-containing protein n=1 Tax=Methanobrevibacter wolinii TaxID=190977 RepID=UPI0005B28FB0|nr:DUF5655 domain-containing protein [Methanobrevibacter wolinii]